MIVLRNVSCNARYWKDPVDISVGQYENGRLAISLLEPETGGPVGTVTCNLVDEACPEGEVWVKEWAEGEGMTQFLIDAGIILPCATDVTTTGYVNVMRYTLTPKFIEAMAKALVAQNPHGGLNNEVEIPNSKKAPPPKKMTDEEFRESARRNSAAIQNIKLK